MTATSVPSAPANTVRPGVLRRLRTAVRTHRFVLDIVLGATLMVVLHVFVLQISVVKGHSMEPSLHDGDRLVVDRVAGSIVDIHRGDVIVLRYPRNPQVDFVKRVVGLPGDRVSLRKGQLWVNDAMVDCDWTCIEDRETTRDVLVPDDSFFVLGDNRPISCDSREFGLVPRDLVRGRVRARFWPLDQVAVF